MRTTYVLLVHPNALSEEKVQVHEKENINGKRRMRDSCTINCCLSAKSDSIHSVSWVNKKDQQVVSLLSYTTLVPVSSGNHTQFQKWKAETCILYYTEFFEKSQHSVFLI